MLVGLLAIFLAKKMKVLNEKNMAKYEERKKQKQAEKEAASNK